MSIDLRPGLLTLYLDTYLYLGLHLWSSAFYFPFHITFTFSWQNWSLSPVYGKLLVSPAIHHVQCFLSHNNCQEPTASRTYLLFLQLSPQVQDLQSKKQKEKRYSRRVFLVPFAWNFICCYDTSHSQMLGKFEYTLPAKFWRLVGCTEMLSW